MALTDRLRGSAPNACPRFRAYSGSWISVIVECIVYAPLGGLILTDDALGVDPEQDFHAMTCPLGHLRGGHACVEPGRDARVAQVVDTLDEAKSSSS